jgi:hypothetical protein
MKKYLKLTLFVLALLCSTHISLAGGMGPPPPGGGMGPKPGCWPPGNPACVPIDGGITLLIAAGLAYGGRKTMQLNKKQA